MYDINAIKKRANELRKKITGDVRGDKIVLPCLDEFKVTNKLVEYLKKIVEKLNQIGAWNRPEEVVSQTRDALHRLETVLMKLEQVSPNDEFPKMNVKREMEDISEELNDGLDKLTRVLNYKEEIVGRDEDIKVLKNYVLTTSKLIRQDEKNGVVIVIRGEPGIGKTSVAQCVYNDEEVRGSVGSVVWSGDLYYDMSNEVAFEWSALLAVIDNKESWPQQEIENWIIDHPVKKCKLIVTTSVSQKDISSGLKQLERSCNGKRRIICYVHELDGLKDYLCWDLFKNKTFINWSGEEEKTQISTSDIYRRVFKNCGNNPRVIKTVAAVLSSMHTLEEYNEFCDVIWPSLSNPIATIRSKLNLDSFKELTFTLQRRLFYCLLFPKDYEFANSDLSRLWSATSIDSESWMTNEIVGDPFLSDLVTRGYFIECSDTNSNISYKMVSFMYELVKSIARVYGWWSAERPTQRIEGSKDLRHVGVIVDSSWHAPTWLLEAKELRSLMLLTKFDEVACISNVQDIFSSFRHLETFHLANINCENLWSYIGQLQNLRYLRLGPFSESRLLEGIAYLQSLRYLGIQRYSGHRLPKEFHNLDNLRYLCTKPLQLTSTNQNLIRGELVCLPTFDGFIGGMDYGKHPLVDYNRLDEKIEKTFVEKYPQGQEEALMCSSIDSSILLTYIPSYKCVLSTWHPSQILTNIAIKHWKGTLLPRYFPALLNCTSIQITDCKNCTVLPDLGILPYLRSLEIWGLSALEYVQIGDENIYYGTYDECFPSLKFLMLANMPRLKKWSNKGNEDYKTLGLSELRISGCPELISMPRISGVENLDAVNIPEELMRRLIITSMTSKLRKLQITSIYGLESLFIKHENLKSLTIRRCQELRYINVKPPSSLEVLHILECGQLTKISYEQLVVEELKIEHCDELNPLDMMNAYHGLESLGLANVSNVTFLPNSLECFTTLKQLTLSWVYNLNILPEWIHSITHLTIQQCHNLTRLPEPISGPSSLQHLIFRHCPRLKHLPINLPNLIHLRVCKFKKLKEAISATENLSELEIENDIYNFDDKCCEKLKGLQSLKLKRISNMELLPQYVEQLTKLERLSIQYCPQLSELPTFLQDLPLLRKLDITGCVHLHRICMSPSPEIRSIIQHIPEIHVDGVELKP